MATAANVVELVRRLERLKALRAVHEPVWRECLEHSFPIRASGLQQAVLSAQTALDRKARLLDDTATDAARLLAAALVSGMTPASSQWFALQVSGVGEADEQWLDRSGKQLHTEIHSANFDAAAYELSLDMVGAGWFALYVDVDRERGGFVFEQWPIAGVYAADSVHGGVVDTVMRCYTLTAEQVVSEFGQDNVSAETLKRAASDPDSPIEVCHAIYPRKTYVIGARMAKNLPVASCHFEVAQKHMLREGGYHEMPVIVPRWVVIPETVYGIGPMFDALPSARTLNELQRMDMTAGEIAISGMWKARDDGVLNPRTVKVGPRKIVVVNDMDSFQELKTGSNWQLATDRIERAQAQIRKVLMSDQLQPADGPAMTATEVHVRVSMIRQLLGPIYGRLQAEYLRPLVERCFALAARAGLFGPPPESLANRSFSVRYMSPLARAQRMEDVGAIERLHQNLQVFATLGQSMPAAIAAADVVKFDDNLRTLVEGLGVPLANVSTSEEVAALREARAEQQAQAQAEAQQQEFQSMAAEGAVQRAVRAA